MTRRSIFSLGIFLLAICAQQVFSQDCPRITVVGPSGIPVPDTPIVYQLQIFPTDRVVALSFLWSVRTAEREVAMVEGQGTTSIRVPYTFDSVTVTVKVFGLPQGCPDTASETMGIDPAPAAQKLIEFLGTLKDSAPATFREALSEAGNLQTARIYVMVYGESVKSLAKKRDTVGKWFRGVESDFAGPRVTFVNAGKGDRVEIWLVPAGAAPPEP